MKTKSTKNDRVHVVTLGCSKNLVDSENLITQLVANDFDVSHDVQENREAEIVVVNTCGFIENAKQESIDTILEYAEAKKDKRIKKLYVTGCLSERYKEDLQKEISEVDAFFGTMELPALLAKFEADYQHELLGERSISTPGHYAYLKISEGCNRTCAFCAIPLMRGKHISRSIDDLVKEAKNLASIGVKEIMLIAQELTYYGLDLYKKRALSELLDALCDVEGIEWIRLHYAYPSKFPLEVFEVMARQKKICNYLDMPLQHASDRVLKLMRRQITIEETMQLIKHARDSVPGIAIRTTMLVGFPGETPEDFEELCRFVEEMEFERLGCFQYSHEEGTSAYDLDMLVPEELKAERANQLMEIQNQISFQKNQDKIGQEFKVLIDRVESGYFVGRTEFDSPEVDNEVLIDSSKHYLRVGDFARIKIIDAEAYDLFGVPV